MAAADYRLLTEATGQRIAAALESLVNLGDPVTIAHGGTGASTAAAALSALGGVAVTDIVNSLTNLSTDKPASAAITNGRFKVISSGSLHDITTSGIYYLTGSVTDKPENNGGMYAVAVYDANLIVGRYISVDGYDDIVIFTNNNWYKYSVAKTPHKITISATTTVSGAIEIPTQEQSNIYINALITAGGPGYVVRRDGGYFTVFGNNGTPLASTSVTFDAYFMPPTL